MNISPFLSINIPCDNALQWAKVQLADADLRTVQTFDLHDVRSGLHDCSCPNHGTEECDCQMVVLLIYGKPAEPVTLFLHGNDRQTWLSIAEDARQRADPNLLQSIRRTLETKMPVIVSQDQ